MWIYLEILDFTMKLMDPGFYHETDDSMWILYKNPGLNLCGFVTEIQDLIMWNSICT